MILFIATCAVVLACLGGIGVATYDAWHYTEVNFAEDRLESAVKERDEVALKLAEAEALRSEIVTEAAKADLEERIARLADSMVGIEWTVAYREQTLVTAKEQELIRSTLGAEEEEK